MALQKPSIPKGTRDFTPDEMIRRNFIFDTVRQVFQVFGYQPIETPAMENLTTLLGKYGDEGDKLLFRILNSGDFLEKVSGDLSSTAAKGILPLIAEKGLRYDLTVPFARFVVQNQNNLVFPFKRYQIQPVWRADRPQKGRYREFFQCDVDVIGSDSLLNEIELVQIADEIFTKLGIRAIIKINNRKILAGIAEIIGEPNRLIDLTVAIDKIEKIGFDGALNELMQKGFNQNSIDKVVPFFNFASENNFETTYPFLHNGLHRSEIGIKGLNEIEKIFHYLKRINLHSEVHFDISLARGLNYYTGAIIEVKSADVAIGSICGGGRYDDLTGIFGLPGVSGVGISFGADRIYDVMNELKLFPETIRATTKVLFVNFGSEEEQYCMSLLQQLRRKGIAAEIYPDSAKLKKQLDYANKKNIPFVVLAGKNEMDNGKVTVKDMKTGEQKTVGAEELLGIAGV
jgi:histidyl-tRNA synthetase